MKTLIKNLGIYRDKMTELVEKDAKERGMDCFEFDTEPFDRAIAILSLLDVTINVMNKWTKGDE